MPKTLAADLKDLMREHGVYDEQKYKKCLKCIRPKRQVSSSHPYRVFQQLIKDDLYARFPMNGGDTKQVFGKRQRVSGEAYRAYKEAGNVYTAEVKQIVTAE